MAEFAIALLSLLGTGLGTLGGIITASRLTNYRLAELEKKVNKHNHLVERMVSCEESLKSAHRRIDAIIRK